MRTTQRKLLLTRILEAIIFETEASAQQILDAKFPGFRVKIKPDGTAVVYYPSGARVGTIPSTP